VVAVASATTRAASYRNAWLSGSLVVLALGTLLRLVARPVDVAAGSAALLSVLLWLCAWLAAVLVLSPRGAFAVGLLVMGVLDLAALPARPVVDYDDRVALFQAGQVVTVQASAASLVLEVEPVFQGATPGFSLGGEVAGQQVTWSCPWRHGRQRMALPLPSSGEVHLQLRGAVSRDGDYLLVYTSSSGAAREQVDDGVQHALGDVGLCQAG
jgi:hypothetical protein